MKKLYYHGGSANHGCEAIVRATKKILDESVMLFSFHPELDWKYKLDHILQIREDQPQVLPRKSIPWLAAAVHHKLTRTDLLYTRFSRNSFFSQIGRGDICMSVGGDNYCYEGQDILAYYNQLIHKRGAKTVLWGCSVEPTLINNAAIAKDLARYDLIAARESISYEALKKINPNTILVADPAFALDWIDRPLPDGWVEGKMVGINASPLILQYSGNNNIVFEAYVQLIRHIIENTDHNVVLVPHVVMPNSDDRGPLFKLLEQFHHTGRVILLEDDNCEVLKGYIRRCSYFVGARTHATIAAYSTGVPTLVIGYSVKSRGIAQDLFGTAEHYVLPVQEITDVHSIVHAFLWLVKYRTSIREHLEAIMPEYIKKAYLVKSHLELL